MASLTWWTWVWVNSGCWWWTRRPGVLQFMGSQRVRQDWVTELNWTHSKTSGAQTSFFPVCPGGVTWKLGWHQASSLVKLEMGVVWSVTLAMYNSEQVPSRLIIELVSLTRKKIWGIYGGIFTSHSSYFHERSKFLLQNSSNKGMRNPAPSCSTLPPLSLSKGRGNRHLFKQWRTLKVFWWCHLTCKKPSFSTPSEDKLHWSGRSSLFNIGQVSLFNLEGKHLRV